MSQDCKNSDLVINQINVTKGKMSEFTAIRYSISQRVHATKNLQYSLHTTLCIINKIPVYAFSQSGPCSRNKPSFTDPETTLETILPQDTTGFKSIEPSSDFQDHPQLPKMLTFNQNLTFGCMGHPHDR